MWFPKVFVNIFISTILKLNFKGKFIVDQKR